MTKQCGDDPGKRKAHWQDIGRWMEDLGSTDKKVSEAARRQLYRMAFSGLSYDYKLYSDPAKWRTWWLRANQEAKPRK